jgi:hypothetical protein
MTFHPITAFFILPVMIVLIELGRRFLKDTDKTPIDLRNSMN